MPESGRADAHLAFLYVSGEMDAPEAADFECRLADEQPLRESLCQAVELMQTLEGLAPPTPRPDYRARVRQRLHTGGKWWHPLAGPRTYRGHPALWLGLGTAAVLAVPLLSWILSSPDRQIPPPTQSPPLVAKQMSPPTPTPHEESDDDILLDIAELWARMENGEHLARAHEEEIRRRDRRLLHGEHTLHPSGSPSARP
jgi:hypothetical protein